MSREVRRVPLDFAAPIGKTWAGYDWPEKFHEEKCPTCKDGYGMTPEAQLLYEQWYGNAPFDPASTGSAPFQFDHPAVRADAERKCDRDAWFYGSGEAAIIKESHRMAALYNSRWCHHLSQDDVDALVEAGRLMDLTHTWDPAKRWQKIEPPVTPTAAQVNEWSLQGMGHDSLNAMYAMRARCTREGITLECPTCKGHGSLEKYEGQRAEAEAWNRPEPPTGEGWQLWQTVSDGGPVTPVFKTPESLINYLATRGEVGDSGDPQEPYAREAAEALVRAGSSLGSFFQVDDGPVLDAARNADRREQAKA